MNSFANLLKSIIWVLSALKGNSRPSQFSKRVGAQCSPSGGILSLGREGDAGLVEVVLFGAFFLCF